jgi:hypothetical protein
LSDKADRKGGTEVDAAKEIESSKRWNSPEFRKAMQKDEIRQYLKILQE